jgi:hypothetical protein
LALLREKEAVSGSGMSGLEKSEPFGERSTSLLEMKRACAICRVLVWSIIRITFVRLHSIKTARHGKRLSDYELREGFMGSQGHWLKAQWASDPLYLGRRSAGMGKSGGEGIHGAVD